MKYNVNLGEKLGEPTEAKLQTSGLSEKIYYPHVRLVGDEELDLPEQGTVTFKYKVIRESSTNDERGHKYECELDLTNLVSAEGDKDERPSKRDTSTEDNLDRLMKEKSKDYEG